MHHKNQMNSKHLISIRHAALYYASESNNINALKFLISCEVDVNAITQKVHIFCSLLKYTCIKILKYIIKINSMQANQYYCKDIAV